MMEWPRLCQSRLSTKQKPPFEPGDAVRVTRKSSRWYDQIGIVEEVLSFCVLVRFADNAKSTFKFGDVEEA